MVPGAYFRSRARVYHKDGKGGLHPFDDALSQKILDALVSGRATIDVRSFGTPLYQCYLKLMKVVLTPGDEEDLVIEFPWDVKSFSAVAAQTGEKSLRRRVLVMALDRIRKPQRLSKILAMKGLPSCSVRENPYLCPGHAPYENFIESLVAKIEGPGAEKLYEQFIECSDDEAGDQSFTYCEKQGIRTVFHGTNHAVMDAILYSGLTPSYRSKGMVLDYFGIDYFTSLEYTRSKTYQLQGRYKLLFFMIIGEPVDYLPTVGAVTIASNRFQLPLAEVTL